MDGNIPVQSNDQESSVVDLFGDDSSVSEESKPAESEKERPEAEAEKPNDARANEADPEDKAPESVDFLTVKYNGEEKALTKEEAVTLAQKGMNYDKKVAELEEVKNSRPMVMLSRLAKQSNLSLEDYVGQIDKAYDQQCINQIKCKLKDTHPDADDATLLELASSQYQIIKHQRELEDQQNKQNQIDQDAEKKKAEDQRADDMIREFVAEYPDVDLNTLKDESEMWEMISNGKTLLEAYQKIENRKLKQQIEAEKLNQKNAQKTTGSLKGEAGGDAAKDPFLAGFTD